MNSRTIWSKTVELKKSDIRSIIKLFTSIKTKQRDREQKNANSKIVVPTTPQELLYGTKFTESRPVLVKHCIYDNYPVFYSYFSQILQINSKSGVILVAHQETVLGQTSTDVASNIFWRIFATTIVLILVDSRRLE